VISVLVTDDHTVLRKGVAALLDSEPDMIAVGEAATADQAVIKARALQPDVILLDLVMPRKSGFDALPELQKVAPSARVIMLSMQTNPSAVKQALISGASGYLSKHASDTDLLDAIRRVAAGSRYVDPELGGDLVISDARGEGGPMFKRLMPRARGMAYMIRRRSAHIEIGLTDLTAVPAGSTNDRA